MLSILVDSLGKPNFHDFEFDDQSALAGVSLKLGSDMLYTVAFLKDGEVVDRFVFTARDLGAFKEELARIRSEFRKRRPGMKEVMSVTSMPAGEPTALN